jgi:CMP/dCMP kinase
MIISFNGKPGSGKSTIAKRLAADLGWPRYYIGGLRRQKAKERGITLAEYNLLGESDPITDFEVDEYQKELAKNNDNFIIEGRTSWYFIPDSIKIYLDVEEKIGAERVFIQLKKSDDRNEDKNLNSLEDVLESYRKREASDSARYIKYYNINNENEDNYDFILNTSYLTEEEAYAKIFEYIKKRLSLSLNAGNLQYII